MRKENEIQIEDLKFIRRSLRKERFPYQYKYGPHQHKNIEINYIIKGECRMQIKDSWVRFVENDCMVIFPGVKHYFEVDHPAGIILAQIEFDIVNLYKVLENVSFSEDYSFVFNIQDKSLEFLKFNNSKRIQWCIQNLIDEQKHKQLNHELLTDYYYRELLILLSREINNNPEFVRNITNKHVRKGLLFIQNNKFSTDISVEKVATHCGISSRRLRQLFQEQTGLSTVTYISNIRILEACNIMSKNPKISIGELAYSLGFSSLQYFSRLFKNGIGVTPRQYRLNLFPKSIN